MPNWCMIWKSVTGVWTGGTPISDNGDFSDLPGVKKGKGLGGNDHIRGNDDDAIAAGTSAALRSCTCLQGTILRIPASRLNQDRPRTNIQTEHPRGAVEQGRTRAELAGSIIETR